MTPAGNVNEDAGTAPDRAGLVLLALILVAGVANLNLSVANVALPDIGKHFDSSQTTLDLIAVGYSLGLAASVLYLGALGDRYGRKLMLLLGLALSVPACLLAAFAWSDDVLFGARVLGGLSAGMAYPTTLALIAALWSGPGRTKSIALWSALGGAIASLGPLVAGALLESLRLGLGVPDHAAAGRRRVPDGAQARPGARQRDDRAGRQPRRHPVGRAGRGADPLDQLRAGPGQGHRWRSGLAAIARGRADRLPDPPAARAQPAVRPARRRRAGSSGSRPCAGIIVFGSLMGAAFVSQQFLQNVLGYSTLEAGAAFLPTIVFMVLVAPRSAKLVESPRRALHAAVRLRVPAARLRHDAAAVGAGHRLLEDRARATRSSGSASASPARPPRTR